MANLSDMSIGELCEQEERFLQQLRSPAVKADDEAYRNVKRQLWEVRDALCDESEVAAQTY